MMPVIGFLVVTNLVLALAAVYYYLAARAWVKVSEMQADYIGGLVGTMVDHEATSADDQEGAAA